MSETPVSLLERLRQRPDAEGWKRLVELYRPLLEHWLHRQGIQAAGLLDDTASTVIEQHLAECSTCQVAVDAVPPDRLIVTLRRGKGGPEALTVSSTAEDTQAPQGQPAPAGETVPPELAEHPRYRVLGVLGRGGMGPSIGRSTG